jgi:hypothetical protein
MLKNKIVITSLATVLGIAAFTGCQKMDRPKLGDYPKDDQVLPAGDLRFYTPFDLPGEEFRYKVADSISGNPAFFSTSNPTLAAGIKGSALQGTDAKAVTYINANDFKNAKSFSISFWMKKAATTGRTEFLFSLVQPGYSWHNSALFLLLENQTATSVTMKLGLKDQWLEGSFNKPMFDGNWHHIVYSYDQPTAKMTYYFDGAVVTGLNGTQTNGPANVNFEQVTNVVLGGWNKHASIAGPTDEWIRSYNGLLDQFRMYNKALSATEVQSLFNAKL